MPCNFIHKQFSSWLLADLDCRKNNFLSCLLKLKIGLSANFSLLSLVNSTKTKFCYAVPDARCKNF